MADYTSLTNVEAALGPDIPLDELSEPSRVQVSEWITNVSGQATVALTSGGATVPVVDPALLDELDILCAREVAYQVMATRGAAGKDDDDTVWDRWHKEFMARLAVLATPGATVVGAGVVTPSSKIDVVPAFTRGMVF